MPQEIIDYEAGLTSKIFICYASEDRQIAMELCSALEKNNIECWIAPRDIMPGMEYGTAIIWAIRKCQIIVLVFSNYADQSPQVKREVERTVDKGMPIITFRIENVLPSESMEFFISNTHWLDAFIHPVEKHIQTLCATIRTFLGQTGNARANDQRMPQQRERDRLKEPQQSIEAIFHQAEVNNTKISIEIAADNNEKISHISKALFRNMVQKGFHKNEIRKCVVALKELLANVNTHSGDPDRLARIEFWYDLHYGEPTFYMRIEDRGKGFDFKSTIDELVSKLESGDREHGLLRAMRYGTNMTCEIKDTCSITWLKAQKPEKLTSVFDGENMVVPVVFDYNKDLLRIYTEIYFRAEYYNFPDNPYFLDLIFEPLRRIDAPFIGYEVRGVHPTFVGLPSIDILASLWVYLQRILPSRRILVFAKSENEDQEALKNACNGTLSRFILQTSKGSKLSNLGSSKQAQFFEDIKLCWKYLRKSHYYSPLE